MRSHRLVQSVLATLALALPASADLSGFPDISGSFEFDDMSGEFTLGVEPNIATFVNGFTAVIGDFSVYHTGVRAWMISPGGMGTAVFDTPGSVIDFQARCQSATTGTVTVFATDGGILGSFLITSASWTNVNITVAPTDPQISHFTAEHTSGAGVLAIDTFQLCSNVTGTSTCLGNGGDGAGCTDCPCNNNAPNTAVGGCLNSVGSSARLLGTGIPSVAADTLRFEVSGVPPTAFCILNSGDNIAPQGMANPCLGLNSGILSASFDGLRCAVGNTRRHGGRSADSNGDVGFTNNGWGPPNGPMAGFAAQAGFVSGQTRSWQVIHREEEAASCMRGLNTTQAVSVTYLP